MAKVAQDATRGRRGVILHVNVDPEFAEDLVTIYGAASKTLPLIDGRELSLDELVDQVADELVEHDQISVVTSSSVLTAATGPKTSSAAVRRQLGLRPGDVLTTSYYQRHRGSVEIAGISVERG